MESYTNYDAGFGIQFPGLWDHQSPLDSPDLPQNKETFTGQEGGVEVTWGEGFGGACTNDAQPSSHDLVLQVLSTLTFNVRRGS